MQFVNNGPEQIEIRKSQNILIVVGAGTVLFSIWSAVKMLGMLFLLRNETVDAILNLADPVEGVSDKLVFWTIVVMTALLVMIILAVQVYVGVSAISEGRGKRRSPVYILLAFFMIISSILYLCTGVFTAEAPEQMGALTRDQSLSTLIIELTSMLMLSQMVISAFKIRKLTGKEAAAKE